VRSQPCTMHAPKLPHNQTINCSQHTDGPLIYPGTDIRRPRLLNCAPVVTRNSKHDHAFFSSADLHRVQTQIVRRTHKQKEKWQATPQKTATTARVNAWILPAWART
jgi:hypothetical protein